MAVDARLRRAVRASPASAQSVRHDGKTDANRKRFDGRDDCARACSPWRVHASRGFEFSGKRLPISAAIHSRAGSNQMGSREGKPGFRFARREPSKGDRTGGRRSRRRKARRSFSARHFPDRLRHEHQHQRERSDREPGGAPVREVDRIARPCSSQRSRQHGAIEQRRDSLGDSHQRR